MNIKQAAEKFNLKEFVIRELCKSGKIHGATKRGAYNIPDDTAMIITDENARAFLYQLLKLKNNPHTVISEAGLDTEEKRKTWYKYMIEQGLIGQCDYVSDIHTLLMNMSLTDKGLDIVFGEGNTKKLISLRLEPSINIACINIG